MEVDYRLLLAEAQLCRSCLCLFQRGHDLPHATWKSFERFPMARTTLQLCNEVFLLEVCENRSCELAGNSELKFFLILTPEGCFGFRFFFFLESLMECCLAFFDESECVCLF